MTSTSDFGVRLGNLLRRVRRLPVGSIEARPSSGPSETYAGAPPVVVSWSAAGTDALEVRVGAPDGPLFSRSGASGSATTGDWVTDGTRFFLQDVAHGRPLSARHTVATAEVSLPIRNRAHAFDKAAVAAAVERHAGSRPKRIRIVPTHTGFLVCEAVLARRSLFFKAARGDDDLSLAREARTCERVRSGGIPAPRVLAFDKTRQLLPCSFLILEEVKGAALDRVDATLLDRTPSLLQSAGRMLREIHALEIEEDSRPTLAPDGRWKAALNEEAMLGIRFLETQAGWSAASVARVRRSLLDREPMINEETTALLHGDFISRHVFVDIERGRITGIIDWEDTRHGDPAFDLACYRLSDPKHYARLLEGYGGQELGPDLEERLALYTTLHLLNGARAHSEAGAMRVSEDLLALLMQQTSTDAR